jgi:YD repeat-containing protein
VVTNTVLRTRQHVYNQTGQLIRDIDALGYSRDYRVDANGNRVATRDALGVVTVDNYDAMDRHIDHGIIRSGAKVTLLTNLYDQAGRLYGEISGANAVEETLQSVANTSNWSSTTTGVAGNTKYSLFDERGNIVKTRNESKVEKSIEYDVNNRKVKETDGLNGTLTWTYDTENFGRLSSRKDLGGRVYSFTYNGFGQLIKETLTTASGAGPDKTYSYYANGLTKAIVEGAVTKDAAGAVIAEDSRTSTYAYDLNGNRIREVNGGRYLNGAVSQSSSNEVRNKFDEQGRLKEVKSPAGNQLVGALGTQYTLVSTARLDLLKYDYDEMGNRRRVYMDTTSQSGGRTVKDDWYKYDLEGRAIVVEGFRNARGKVVAGALGSGNTTATAKAKGYALTYNAIGQRTSSERWKGFFLRSGHHEDDLTAGELYEVEVYSYNDLGQLTYTVGRAAGREYNYGALTDTSQGSVSPRSITERFPAELLRQTKYSRSYDDRGNLISQKVYAYTMANITTAGSTTRYTYRGDGQVISQFSYNSAQQLAQASYFGEGDMLDAAGNQRGYRYVSYNSNGSINHRGNFSSEQILFDSYKESKATLTRTNGGSPGTTTYTYSARGELRQTVGTGGNVFTRGLATNAEGRLIERRESSGVAQTYLYYQGAALANIGNAAVPEISDTFTPISPDYPERTPSNYVVNQGDTLQSIAQSVWGDSNMWYLIADANGLDSSKPLNPGDNLKIPNVVSSTHNDADTFKPYSPDDVIGNTAPTPKAPPPPKPKKKKSGGLATVVMVVVAVVATVFTAGAATAVISGAASTLGGAAAAGTAALSAAAAGTAATISIGGAIIGAAVGSAASQLVGMGMGAVDKFSWGQVAASGITGGLTYGITSGIGTLAQGAQPGSWAQIAASAARTYSAQGVFNYAASQVANRIVGLDTSFSWNRLASSVVAANVSGQLNGRFGNQLSGQIVSGQVGAYASAAISDKWLGGSRPNHVQIAADAFGNTLGNFFVDQFRESSDEAVQRTMKLAGLPDDEVYKDDIGRGLANGVLPEQLGDFYTHPGTRQVALHPTRPGENGGFMSYEGDGVWVGVPPLQEPITYSVGDLEGVLSLNGNSTLVDWANNFTPVVHERLVGFGNFAAEHEGATKLLSYAAQAFSYAVMGPFAVMRDIATEAVLGAAKSQVHDYAVEKVGDYYQSQGVRADNAVILANGTVFGVETVAGKVTSAVNGAKLYAMQMSGKATQNSEAVDLALKYKPGWTDEQRVEAAAKAKILNDAPTVVTASERSGTAGAMNRYRRTEQTPTGRDIDHMVDLQLGGSKTIDNLWPLDASVNRSLGSQVQHQIKNLPPGTVINRVTIGD